MRWKTFSGTATMLMVGPASTMLAMALSHTWISHIGYLPKEREGIISLKRKPLCDLLLRESEKRKTPSQTPG
jgi:hypothetical protein